MTSDFTTDPFRAYPARDDYSPRLSPMARIDRAHRRLLLAQATEGEARSLFWLAVNAALNAGVKQSEIVRKTGYTREAIRLNRRTDIDDAPPPAPAESAAAEPSPAGRGGGWTVGQLRAALADLPDNTPLAVHAPNFNDNAVYDELVLTDAGFGTVDWGEGFGPEPSSVFALVCQPPTENLEQRPQEDSR